MLPSVLLIANSTADGSINRVITIMLVCISDVASGNSAGIIYGINMNAIADSAAISSVAVVSIVCATSCASFLSFTRYSVNIGKKAAVSAPAINKLNKRSGIINDALYVSVALVVPKLTAITLSLISPIP